MDRKPANKLYPKDKRKRAIVSAGVLVFKSRAKSLHSVKMIQGKYIGTR